jgi:hypothetical protein
MSRILKFGPRKQEEFLKLLRKGWRRTHAARKIGIDPETYRRHFKSDPGFLEKVEEAEMEANEAIEMALFKTAYEGNFNAQKFWLTNRLPDNWTDKQNVKISGDADSPLVVGNIFADIEKLAEEYERQFNKARELAAVAVDTQPRGDQQPGLEGDSDPSKDGVGEPVHPAHPV